MAFKLLTSLKNEFLELLFPIKCAVCERETEGAQKNKLICLACLKNLTPSLSLYCPLCEAKTIDGGLCFSCKMIGGETGNFKLDKLLYPFSYKDPTVEKIIKVFKYDFIKGLAEPIEKLMANYLKKIKERIDLNELLGIPIPLHRIKFNHRGYNQSELIADEIAKCQNIKVLKNCLVKIKSTKDQAKLKENERLKNLNGAFKCLKPELISGQKILLVDDVYTSGATMNECAKVLKEAGAKEVIGLVIARG
ncbi:MAG: ComF family protein [Candidatus Paceibacteria bacterium]